ncbi:MAG: hypothetical protein HY297_05990 [Thaumarchaeota archaeon]|nr:hypothetical protein [Nitrososphaerota archaeon]
MARARVAVVLAVLAVVGGAGLFAWQAGAQTESCRPPTLDAPGTYQTQRIQFGAVTEYCLPNPLRLANGIAVAPDGSVWFGEQALPGLGHLFTNGTVREYPWSAWNEGGFKTGIWGVSLWDGRVWGTDSDNSALVGVDPAGGTPIVLDVSVRAPFPYTLTVSPDNSLWFTSLSSPAKLGRVGSDMAVTTFSFEGFGGLQPIQVEFVNSTSGYLAALSPLDPAGDRGLYRFSVDEGSRTVGWSKVEGHQLSEPVSVSVSGGVAWVAQHGPSNIVGYEIAARAWTVYPTTPVAYSSTTLPYFVEAQGSSVWFNEHYGNRVGHIDAAAGTLTEYSESDPAAADGDHVQNDLTIAVSPNGLWFTSMSGGYVGFVDGTHDPGFSISTANGTKEFSIHGPSIRFDVTGSWSKTLRVLVSDSENSSSVPSKISIVPYLTTLPAGSGPRAIPVDISAKPSLLPGRYTIGITVTDGLVYQTAYVFVTVD